MCSGTPKKCSLTCSRLIIIVDVNFIQNIHNPLEPQPPPPPLATTTPRLRSPVVMCLYVCVCTSLRVGGLKWFGIRPQAGAAAQMCAWHYRRLFKMFGFRGRSCELVKFTGWQFGVGPCGRQTRLRADTP